MKSRRDARAAKGKRLSLLFYYYTDSFIIFQQLPMHVPVVSQQFDLPILVGQAVGIQKVNRRH